MKDKNNQDIKTFSHTLFLDRYVGKKVHLYLKNRFHYFCEVSQVRDVNGEVFIEIFDLKKKLYLLLSSDVISGIQEVKNG